MSTACVIGLDIGGTDIKSALTDHTGCELLRGRRATPVQDGVPAVLDSIVDEICQLRDRAGTDHVVVGIGLILPGLVDSSTGIARYSTNIGWQDLPIQDLIRQRTALPVAIDHDVRAAGLAEARLGAARDVADALYLAIGTGISGALITEGRVLTGARQMAGEIGHLPAFPGGQLCACGQHGCTEAYASAVALPRRYLAAGGGAGDHGGRGDSPGRNLQPLRAEDVLSLAATGDPIAQTVFDEAITALARALISCTLLLDPELIVLGGGLACAGAALIDPLSQRIQEGLAWREAPAVVPAQFGADSGRVGAGLIGWDAYRDAGGDGPYSEDPDSDDPSGKAADSDTAGSDTVSR